MGGFQLPERRVSVQERQSGKGSRPAPVPAVALPVPVTKVSTGPDLPVPGTPRTTPHREHQEFRRSGLLPKRDTDLQRQERRLFGWIFVLMMMSFAGLLAVILASRL